MCPTPLLGYGITTSARENDIGRASGRHSLSVQRRASEAVLLRYIPQSRRCQPDHSQLSNDRHDRDDAEHKTSPWPPGDKGQPDRCSAAIEHADKSGLPRGTHNGMSRAPEITGRRAGARHRA